jgi:hypothetical protein
LTADQVRKLALERRAALLADEVEFDRLALRLQLARLGLGGLDEVRVEAAAQPLVGVHHHKEIALVRARTGQQARGGIARHLAREARHHRGKARGIGPRRLGRSLGTAQLGRRDHLLGLGDLLGRLDRVDPALEFLE